jgi:hypothetical protein
MERGDVWMKRLFASALLAVSLVGCSGLRIGVPTVSLTLDKTEVISENIGTTDSPIIVIRRQFTLNVESLPGSPAGVLEELNLTNGNTAPSGIKVVSCPTTGPSPTNPCASKLTIGLAIDPAGETKLAIQSYTISGLNGNSLVVTLNKPLGVN